MKADEIIRAARSCLGTPFRHQGRIPGVGMDCAGLAVYALTVAGVPVIDRQGYGRIPNEGRLKKAIEDQPALIRVAKPQAGDVVLIRFGQEPAHVGILTAEDCIIHAYENVGRVVEHRLDEAWQARIIAAYRVTE